MQAQLVSTIHFYQLFKIVKNNRNIIKMFKLLKSSKIPLGVLLTKRYRLDQINEAIDDLESGSVFRPLIVMDHGE